MPKLLSKVFLKRKVLITSANYKQYLVGDVYIYLNDATQKNNNNYYSFVEYYM